MPHSEQVEDRSLLEEMPWQCSRDRWVLVVVLYCIEHSLEVLFATICWLAFVIITLALLIQLIAASGISGTKTERFRKFESDTKLSVSFRIR